MPAGALSNEPTLTVEGLRKTYPSGNRILRVLWGLDLQVFPGQVIAVMGASGSGKSTLLHLIGGLDRADAGHIYLRKEEITTAGEEKRATLRNRFIGFVFQYHHLLAEFSALENVQIPLQIAGRSTRDARGRAAELLQMVGLRARQHHLPGRLSGGEQQRVALARALANNPPLILADEPTGNLDRATGEELHRLLYSLARKGQQSWIVATHNEYLAQLADIRLRLEEGRLVAGDASGAFQTTLSSEGVKR